jgi:hypothetical protein
MPPLLSTVASAVKGVIHASNEAKKSDSVKVCIRMRPMSKREIESQDGLASEEVWSFTQDSLEQIGGGGAQSGKPYQFDVVFDESKATLDVYEGMALPIVEKAMDGYNATIFAYGQVIVFC